jgi:hypothetical protein
MDRLNPLDAVFVDAEDADPRTSMAIASIAVFEGPAPSHEGQPPPLPAGRQGEMTSGSGEAAGLLFAVCYSGSEPRA